MKKKTMTCTILAATVTMLGAAGVFAQGTDRVEAQGIAFELPEEIRDLVTVRTDGLEADELVSVYETASLDAAAARGDEDTGAGWIFSISAIPEDRMRELRCGGMDGMEVFAEDEDVVYVFNHPTDVRMVRASNDEMNKGMDQWTMINEWASQEVRQEILANNPELDEEFYTNTDLDMHLAQAAYRPGTKFELRAVDYGPDPLDPAALGENDYIEDLAEDYTYEMRDDVEEPAGEYYVLAFDDDGEEVRFDFFKTSEDGNLVREVRQIGDEEYETYYQANAKDVDEDQSVTDVMAAWCHEIATGTEMDD